MSLIYGFTVFIGFGIGYIASQITINLRHIRKLLEEIERNTAGDEE